MISLNLDKKQQYIVSVSGGVDSMVLMHLMLKKYNIVVVHFDHQVRVDSYKDNELIQNYIKNFNIPYHYIKLSIKNGNFQEKARNERYHHLKEIADQYNTPYIVTAHHLDDLAETILMKLARGSNLYGYAGFKEITYVDNYIILRPLIHYEKNDLINYANQHNIPYLNDSSNFKKDYFRNRIRLEVLPLIKREGYHLQKFLDYSNQVSQAFDYIRLETKKFLNDSSAFSLHSFKNLHKAIQFDIIAYLLESAHVELSQKKLDFIHKSLLNDHKPNIDIKLSNRYILRKTYDDIYIVENKQESKPKLPILNISHKKVSDSMNSVEICYNKLDFPLQIRHRKPGDVLHFTFGKKKLKSYLIDKKIPLHQRNQLWIVTDQNDTILWIPGLYKNETLGNQEKLYISIKESKYAQ